MLKKTRQEQEQELGIKIHRGKVERGFQREKEYFETMSNILRCTDPLLFPAPIRFQYLKLDS